MTQVIVNPELRAKLNGLSEEAVFVDESGQSLGHFFPSGKYRELLNLWVDSLFTEEELRKAEEETGGRPLSEIWRTLGRT